jgi:hypothetical protein
MNADIDQAIQNLEFIEEGLSVLSANAEDQLRLNGYLMLKNLNNVFDIIPAYYVPWLQEKKFISVELGNEILSLYKEIEDTLDPEFNEELDQFIVQNSSQLKEWRIAAKALLEKVHNLSF